MSSVILVKLFLFMPVDLSLASMVFIACWVSSSLFHECSFGPKGFSEMMSMDCLMRIYAPEMIGFVAERDGNKFYDQ